MVQVNTLGYRETIGDVVCICGDHHAVGEWLHSLLTIQRASEHDGKDLQACASSLITRRSRYNTPERNLNTNNVIINQHLVKIKIIITVKLGNLVLAW